MDGETFIDSIENTVLTLARISDRRQRGYALAARLKNMECGHVVGIMRGIRDRALEGNEDFLRLYNSMLVAEIFVEVLGEARLSELITEARRMSEYAIVALLMDMPGERTDDQPFQPFLDSALREVPLGMRKSMARRPDFKMIQRIARDQDHRVIRTLLSNPRLTEKDVIQIGATRPTSPKVLEEIYNHPKWIAMYSVKKVIVFNPHSPLSLSLRLLTYLKLEDLEALRRTPELDPVLSEQAARTIQEKMRAYEL